MSDPTGPARPVSVPVVRSILSVDGVAEVLAREYGLEEVTCRLEQAVTIDSYGVKSKTGSFTLRVHPARRTEDEVRGELEFMRRLDAAGIPVTAPVPRVDGSLWLPVEAAEGTRIAVLFAAAPGGPLSERGEPRFVNAHGALLARLHLAADAFPPLAGRAPLTVESLVDAPKELLVSAYGPRSSAGYMARYAADLVRPVIASLPLEAPVYGLCHGDPGMGNALVTGDGRLTLTGFDFCGPAWRAHDLAVALNELPGDYPRGYLAAYREAREPTAEEMHAIPHFQAAHYLWLVAMRTRHVNEWGAFAFTDRQVMHTFAKVEALLPVLKRERPAEIPVG